MRANKRGSFGEAELQVGSCEQGKMFVRTDANRCNNYQLPSRNGIPSSSYRAIPISNPSARHQHPSVYFQLSGRPTRCCKPTPDTVTILDGVSTTSFTMLSSKSSLTFTHLARLAGSAVQVFKMLHLPAHHCRSGSVRSLELGTRSNIYLYGRDGEA